MTSSEEGALSGETSGLATRKEWWGLALLVMPMLTLATDLTVLFLALPTLSADLSATATQALWIVHIYGFVVAGFLVTMGRLGDRIGPRRLMLMGAIAFSIFSVVAAFSTSATMLIVTRALLGVAGATLMPSLFSLLRTMFADDSQRRVAIAIMFSAFSVGGAIGPLLGGVLLEYFWWGSVFLINVPPMAVLVLAGTRLLPERTQRNLARLDLVSVALSVAGMLTVIYGVTELASGTESDSGWTLFAVIAAGAVVLGLFVRRQRRLDDPLFNLALLADRRITVSLLTLLLSGIGLVGVFFLVTQYLQWVAELTPLQAGLWTLPYIAVNIAGAMLGPLLTRTLRPAVVIALGLSIAAVGAVALVVIAGLAVPLPVLITAFSVIGLGNGAAAALVSDLIISSAPEEQTGSAAAAQEVGGELGSALGIAAGGAIGVAAYQSAMANAMPAGISESVAETATGSIHGGVTAAKELGPAGTELLGAVHSAITLGLQVYTVVATILAVLAVGLVVRYLLVRPRSRGPRRVAAPSAANSTVSESAVPDLGTRLR